MQIRLNSIDTSSASSFPTAYISTSSSLNMKQETPFNSIFLFGYHPGLHSWPRKYSLRSCLLVFTAVQLPSGLFTETTSSQRLGSSPSPFFHVHPVELRILFSWPVCYIMLLSFQKKYSVLIFLPLEIKNLSMLPAVILIHFP